MKTNFYAIFDKKAETYGMPFPALNHAVACRMVSASMDEGSMLRLYPHDYRVEKVATFEDTFAMFDSPEKKEIVAEVSNLVPLPFDDGVGTDDGERETV